VSVTTEVPCTAEAGPPRAGPLTCFWCLIAACAHQRCEGTIPAVTAYNGTLYCFDCAERAANLVLRDAQAPGL